MFMFGGVNHLHPLARLSQQRWWKQNWWKDNLCWSPQTTGGTTPSPAGNLRASCSVCTRLSCLCAYSPFNLVLFVLVIHEPIAHLGFNTLCPVLLPTATSLPPTWIPSLMSPCKLTAHVKFHIKQSFPWIQLCKHQGQALHVFSKLREKCWKTLVAGSLLHAAWVESPLPALLSFDFLVAEGFSCTVRLTVKSTRLCIYVGVEAFCILTEVNSCSE